MPGARELLSSRAPSSFRSCCMGLCVPDRLVPPSIGNTSSRKCRVHSSVSAMPSPPPRRIGRGGFSCDARPWVMCPRVRVPLFSMILVRHVIRIQRGDESGCRGRYHRCFAVVLCCLDVVNVVPKLDSQLCTPRAATAYVSWSFVNVSVLPGSGCVAPVAGLPVIAGPA